MPSELVPQEHKVVSKRITIVLFVYNEESRIRYFLDSVKNFCPIVVIDNFSSDKTVRIAKEYTDSVFQFKNPGYTEHPAVIEFALSHVTTEWVFSARADEIPPRSLLKKIDEITQNDMCDIVRISRLDILFGEKTNSWGNDYQTALFKKEYLDSSQNALYENAFLNTARKIKLPPTKELSIWHFSSYDVETYTNTNNRYSTITANMAIERRSLHQPNFSHSSESIKVFAKTTIGKIQQSRKLTSLRIIFNPGLRFFWHYFIRGGIKSGWAGFVTSYLMMMEQMLTELKIWELENNISRDKINNYYDELKTALVTGEIPDLKKDPFNN